MPSLHTRQEVDEFAPNKPEYVPATQFRQLPDVPAPVASEYVPSGHATQSFWSVFAVDSVYLPAPQSPHVASEAAPVSGEYLPATHLVQDADTVVFLYFPAAQGPHGPPFGPVNPTLHEQYALLARLLELRGQTLHS